MRIIYKGKVLKCSRTFGNALIAMRKARVYTPTPPKSLSPPANTRRVASGKIVDSAGSQEIEISPLTGKPKRRYRRRDIETT